MPAPRHAQALVSIRHELARTVEGRRWSQERG
jgi:hypothetical protein